MGVRISQGAGKLRVNIIRKMPHLIKANRDFNTIGAVLGYIFSTLFFFQIVIVQCMHIIYQMKEFVCVNIFFKINIKKRIGLRTIFVK